MPDDFGPIHPLVTPCVPRYRDTSVPVADGPHNMTTCSGCGARLGDGHDSRCPILDVQRQTFAAAIADTEDRMLLDAELEQARQARDLLNRLVDEGKITMHGECFFEEIDQEPWHRVSRLRICRLVPRTVYDEEPLP